MFRFVFVNDHGGHFDLHAYNPFDVGFSAFGVHLIMEVYDYCYSFSLTASPVLKCVTSTLQSALPDLPERIISTTVSGFSSNNLRMLSRLNVILTPLLIEMPYYDIFWKKVQVILSAFSYRILSPNSIRIGHLNSYLRLINKLAETVFFFQAL